MGGGNEAPPARGSISGAAALGASVALRARGAIGRVRLESVAPMGAEDDCVAHRADVVGGGASVAGEGPGGAPVKVLRAYRTPFIQRRPLVGRKAKGGSYRFKI